MRAHFVGVGGIGMSALAQWLRADGWRVSGTDRVRSDITAALEHLGVQLLKSETVVPKATTMLVYSDAVPSDHAARHAARARRIRERSYAELLGELTARRRTIAVAGSHGKSTTTALVGLLLEAAGKDPTVVVGTRVPKWERRKEKGELFTLGNYRRGGSDIAVVEADEYRKHFLDLKPMIGVVTTLDHDHVDAFPTRAEYEQAFRDFVGTIPPTGSLVLPADDDSVSFLRSALPASVAVATFAVGEGGADVVASRPVVQGGAQRFTLTIRGKLWGEFSLLIPGEHVVRNLAAAVAAGLPFGGTPESVHTVLRDFRGTWRRFELVGEVNGAPVISDYAHHPTELRALAAAARQRYTGKRLLIAFQPHQRARTRAFAPRFIEALAQFDDVILTEVYDVAGREENEHVSTRDWVEPLRAAGRPVLYAPTLRDVENAIRAEPRAGMVAFIVGAGDVDVVARRLVAVDNKKPQQ